MQPIKNDRINRMARDGRRVKGRAEAVRLAEKGEKTIAQIAMKFGIHRTTLHSWLRSPPKEASETCSECSEQNPTLGRPFKLNKEQMKELRRMVITSGPERYGLDGWLWTQQTVAHLIHEKFKDEKGENVKVDATVAGRYLSHIGVAPRRLQNISHAMLKDDIKDIEKDWMRLEFPELKRKAKKEGMRIFFLADPIDHPDPKMLKSYGLGRRRPNFRVGANQVRYVVDAKGLFRGFKLPRCPARRKENPSDEERNARHKWTEMTFHKFIKEFERECLCEAACLVLDGNDPPLDFVDGMTWVGRSTLAIQPINSDSIERMFNPSGRSVFPSFPSRLVPVHSSGRKKRMVHG